MTVTDTTDSAARRAAAAEFLEISYRELGLVADLPGRLQAVNAEIRATGTYRHTSEELRHGARMAWRNSVRCVGRVRWQSLVVRDARTVLRPSQVARQLFKHLEYATNGGRIRSTITVFAPDDERGPRVRIFNEQLIRYAGWRPSNGPILGDPRYVGFTDLAVSLGWRAPRWPSRWDILPLVIDTALARRPIVYAIPAHLALQVPLSHPEHDWFAELDLRWPALPVISYMRLHIGGVNYSAAPFNGFYLGDEIGSRNLADPDRYNQVPAVGQRLGLDTSTERTLWRDRTVIELIRAVLHSFDQANVAIADHHAEADLFMRFAHGEERAGRCPHADATWINSHPVPPQTPTFHRVWDATQEQPNYWLDADARQRAAGDWDGVSLRRQRDGGKGHRR